MLRTLTALMMALAASACTMGLPSAVDAIPYEARLTAPPFPDGHYCQLEKDDDGRVLVGSNDADNGGACRSFFWNAASHDFTVAMSGAGEAPLALSVADLGGGLLLLQFARDDEGREKKPYAFILMVGMAHGGALSIIPLPSGSQIAEFAAGQSSVLIAPDTSPGAPKSVRPPPPPDESGGDVTTIETPEQFYIAAGSPEDVRAFARDFIMTTFAQADHDRIDKDRAKGDLAPFMVRDQAGQADHAPTPDQQADIDALMDKWFALINAAKP